MAKKPYIISTFSGAKGELPSARLVGSPTDLSGYATQTWVSQQGYLTLSSLPVYNGGVT